MKATLECWIARDSEVDNLLDGTDLFLYPYKPDRVIGNFIDRIGHCMSLPTELFPFQKWEDEPRKVIVTIEIQDL